MRTLFTYPTALRPTYYRPQERVASSLHVDVREDGDKYVLEADLPGVKEADIKLEVKEQSLSISTEPDKSDEKGLYLVRERGASRYARRLALPRDADTQRVEAVFENGVLKVEIPKQPEAQTRSIEVKRA